MGVLLVPGQVFANDFTVVAPLAEGGMGSLWVVEQIQTGKRRALKTMNVNASDESTRKRFAQEARIGAMIQSEHIVDVIAAGVDAASGTPWLVMELLEGEDLDHYIEERGALPPAEVKEIFTQLCHAVAAAHDIPIVHRDLKPENIFLAKSRMAGQTHLVKVLDFGIAKVLTGQLHATGNLGTPLWMSPEQTDTRVGVSAATDVWALGLIAFRLLSGRYYWLEAYAADAQPATILREILFEPMPAASARSAELRGAALPAGFDGWFAKATHRDKSQRFQHAREAALALSAVLSGDAAAHTIPAPWTPSAPSSPNMALAETQGFPATGPQANVDTGPRGGPPQAMVGTTGGATLTTERRSSTGWIIGAVLGTLVLCGGAFGAYLATHPSPAVAPTNSAATTSSNVAPTKDAGVATVTPSASVAPSASIAVLDVSIAPSTTSSPTSAPTHVSTVHRPKGSGLLFVSASGGWCNVFVDGAPQGATPIADLKVTEGTHVIKCERQAGPAQSTTVVVKDGESVRSRFNL